MKACLILSLCIFSLQTLAQKNALRQQVNAKAEALQEQVITWRRDFHEHPELGNHEVRTSAIIAKYLQSLGIEVTTGIATTGVIGILKGGHPGPVVALRADMDGLPVIERTPPVSYTHLTLPTKRIV